jgi:hypothetical protein
MIYGIPYAMILYIEQFDYHFHDAKEHILANCLYIIFVSWLESIHSK